MTTVPQLRALGWYAGQLALANNERKVAMTADLLDPKLRAECGCTYSRPGLPIGGVIPDLVLTDPCEAHA